MLANCHKLLEITRERNALCLMFQNKYRVSWTCLQMSKNRDLVGKVCTRRAQSGVFDFLMCSILPKTSQGLLLPADHCKKSPARYRSFFTSWLENSSTIPFEAVRQNLCGAHPCKYHQDLYRKLFCRAHHVLISTLFSKMFDLFREAKSPV